MDSLLGYNDWQAEDIRHVVRVLREMEKNGTFWTPLGIFNETFVQFLVDKDIIDLTDNPFYLQYTAGGYKRWLELKRLVYKTYMLDDPSIDTKKAYLDNSDYIATSISKKFQFAFKNGHSIAEYRAMNKNILPTMEELEDYKFYKYNTKHADDYEKETEREMHREEIKAKYAYKEK